MKDVETRKLKLKKEIEHILSDLESFKANNTEQVFLEKYGTHGEQLLRDKLKSLEE